MITYRHGVFELKTRILSYPFKHKENATFHQFFYL